MENYILREVFNGLNKELITIDHNFEFVAKSMKKLAKVCANNSKRLAWVNVALLGAGMILYVHDKEIEKLKKDVEQLKSGEDTTSEVKAE